MTYKTEKERKEAILTSKRLYWKRHRSRLVPEAKKRYQLSRSESWIDGRSRAAHARMSVAEIQDATTDPIKLNALLEIREVQEAVLRITHGLLRQWSCLIVKSMLEREHVEHARILQHEVSWVSEHCATITAQIAHLVGDAMLYDIAMRMGAHTRDANDCLADINAKSLSGILRVSYVQRCLFSDLYVS